MLIFAAAIVVGLGLVFLAADLKRRHLNHPKTCACVDCDWGRLAQLGRRPLIQPATRLDRPLGEDRL